MEIKCEGKLIIDEWGERIQTKNPRIHIYLTKGLLKNISCGTKFKIIIKEELKQKLAGDELL